MYWIKCIFCYYSQFPHSYMVTFFIGGIGGLWRRKTQSKEDAVEGRRIAPLPPGPPLAPPRFLRLCHCKTAWKSARLIELCSSGTRDDSLHINISLTACNHSFSNISPHEQSLVLLQFLGFTPYFARIIVSCDYWGDFDYCDSIAIVVILLRY